jgi:hypothetical protein
MIPEVTLQDPRRAALKGEMTRPEGAGAFRKNDQLPARFKEFATGREGALDDLPP